MEDQRTLYAIIGALYGLLGAFDDADSMSMCGDNDEKS